MRDSVLRKCLNNGLMENEAASIIPINVYSQCGW